MGVDFNPTAGHDSGRVRRDTESTDGGFGILLRPTRVEPSEESVIDFLMGGAGILLVPRMGAAGILLREALSMWLAFGGLAWAEVLLGDSSLKSCELPELSSKIELSRLSADQRLLSGDVLTPLDKEMLLSHDKVRLDGLILASLFLAGILFLFVL